MITYTATALGATAAAPDPEDTADEADVVAVWWRMRRWHGVPLPAQRDLIIHTGGADPSLPGPRTQQPQPEAGRPGGAV